MKVPEDRDRLTFCGFKKREPLQFSNVRFGSKSAVTPAGGAPPFTIPSPFPKNCELFFLIDWISRAENTFLKSFYALNEHIRFSKKRAFF